MHSLDAHCFACGYDTLLMVGGLMSNHHEYSLGPVTCETCKGITTANFRAAALSCQLCNGADVSPMRGQTDTSGGGSGRKSNAVASPLRQRFSHDHLQLHGSYRCPRCGLVELKFGTDYMEHGTRSVD